jgi:serine/threonine protein kinase
MAILPGQTLVERYRVLHQLSHSASGGVYRAVDLEVGRDVAIKETIDPPPDVQYQFRSIAARLQAIEHPQLPAVYDTFYLDEIGQYLVTAYIDGIDLQSLIDQYGALPTNIVLDGARAACLPLAHLHAHHLYHLNVKPPNIRITPDGDIYLTDFGLPGLALNPNFLGYVSPEEAAGASIGAACDIYSMGATVYAALTGAPPPTAQERESGVALRPIHTINPHVPEQIDEVVARALERDPKQRYRSIENFSKALGRSGAANGVGIIANIFGLR